MNLIVVWAVGGFLDRSPLLSISNLIKNVKNHKVLCKSFVTTFRRNKVILRTLYKAFFVSLFLNETL